jgi:hypothetical protein
VSRGDRFERVEELDEQRTHRIVHDPLDPHELLRVDDVLAGVVSDEGECRFVATSEWVGDTKFDDGTVIRQGKATDEPHLVGDSNVIPLLDRPRCCVHMLILPRIASPSERRVAATARGVMMPS